MKSDNIAVMTVKDYIKMRSTRKFTANAIENYLNGETSYFCKVFRTFYSGKDSERWNRAKFWETVEDHKPKIPTHFTYIKFYTEVREKEPDDVEIYALVAGKTQLKSREILFQVDENSEFCLEKIDYSGRKDKAKKWLGVQKDIRWCYEKIMIVLDPNANELSDKEQENLAYSVEADIGGLFGLFTS